MNIYIMTAHEQNGGFFGYYIWEAPFSSALSRRIALSARTRDLSVSSLATHTAYYLVPGMYYVL